MSTSGELVPIQADTHALMAPVERLSMTEMIEVGKVLAASGWFRDLTDPGKAAVKIMLGAEMGVSALTAVRGIHVIETKRGPVIQLAGDLVAKLMKAHGYDWTFVAHDASICTLRIRHGDDVLGDVSYTAAQAKRARLGEQGGPWQTFPEDMLFNRAITRAQKRFAPEVTGGLPMPVVEAEVADDLPASREQVVALHAATPSHLSRDERLEQVGEIVGRRIDSYNDLTRAEIGGAIEEMHLRFEVIQSQMFEPDQAPGISPDSPGASAGPPLTEGPAGISVEDGTEGKAATGAKGNPEAVGSPGAASADTRAGGVTGGSGPAPPRTRAKPDLHAAQREATAARQQLVDRAPIDPLHTLPPETRMAVLKFLGGDLARARGLVEAAMTTWGIGYDEEWPEDKLVKLRARFPTGTFE